MATEQEKYSQSAQKGAYVRRPTRFHSRLSRSGEFPAQAGRYVLYVAKACPWAHRTLVVRALLGLQQALPVVLTGYKLENMADADPAKYRGWDFDSRICKEPHGFQFIDQLYEHGCPGYRASFLPKRPAYSVPVLFDSHSKSIVSNESSEIIVMLNEVAGDLLGAAPALDLYPEPLRSEIDEVNAWVYSGINDGVYRCGFAKLQDAYDSAHKEHWEAMDRAEKLLSQQRWLVGSSPTLADVRLFTTLVRYDTVYHTHFKTARSRLADMPALLRHTREMLSYPGVTDTVSLSQISMHYYWSQRFLNPRGIVPRGPREPPGIGDLVQNEWHAFPCKSLL